MKVTIKILNGPGCDVEIDGSSTIRDLKKKVAAKLDVAPDCQRLVFRGKPLTDESAVEASGLTQGSKVFLVVKAADPPGPGPTPREGQLWRLLPQVLAKHFSPEDAPRVLEQFKKDFYANLGSLSLDDIERLATATLTAGGEDGS